MRASDILVLSLRQLRERRLRTILTLLAVAVGVTSIIALSAQVEGVKNQITQSLQKLGPDTVIVMGQGRTQLFTDADVSRLRSLEGVSAVTPVLMTSVKVTGIDDPVNLVAVSSVELVNFLGEVRLLDGDIYYDVPAPQALIGRDVAIDETGETRYKAGQPILVQMGSRPTMMTVAGVLDQYGASMMIQADKSVFTSIEYAKTLLRTGGYTIIIVKAQSAESVDQVAELVRYIFGGSATIMSVKQITEIVVTITSQINLLLLAIAGTSFIAAGLGTFNIMMISVLERVREIGVLKALGMKDRGVLILYMSQGLLLGLFGSLAGLGLGSIAAYAIPILLAGGFGAGQGSQPSVGGFGASAGANIMGSYTPVIGSIYLVVATGLSVAVTLLSSAYPAWKASKMSPVDALRYE